MANWSKLQLFGTHLLVQVVYLFKKKFVRLLIGSSSFLANSSWLVVVRCY